MTINYVQEMWSRQTSSEQSSDGKNFRVTYASAYQVSHSADETLDNIRRAPGIPRVGQGFGALIYVRCTQVGDVQKLGPCYSVVPVSWAGERSFESDDPLAKEPEIKYASVSSEAETDVDGRGFPITNINGEPVYGVKRTINDMQLSVKRNYAGFNGTLALQYLDSTNIDPFFVLGDVWAPGQAAMTRFDITPIKAAAGFQYYAINCEITLRQPYNVPASQAWWSRYRNEGMYERVGTSVSFTGGGGSGAYGYALTSTAGAITNIVVTDRGTGYTSAPSVVINGPPGSSGAAATATISNGSVSGVTVNTGGTGYRSRLIHTVDQDGKPMTKPVLLSATGQREFNASNAVWLTRPSKQFQLSYNALGLL